MKFGLGRIRRIGSALSLVTLMLLTCFIAVSWVKDNFQLDWEVVKRK